MLAKMEEAVLLQESRYCVLVGLPMAFAPPAMEDEKAVEE
jgi:hypothetical protein